jgi:integration host factor subunit alpha
MPNVGKALTRVELYDAVYRKVGLSRSESPTLVELVLKEISDAAWSSSKLRPS